MKNGNKKPDPMKGVLKSDTLREHIRKCVAGVTGSRSYIRGAIQYLEWKPPNPHIVPLLRYALEKSK